MAGSIGEVRQVPIVWTCGKTAAKCLTPVIWQTPQGTGFNGYPEVGAEPKGYTAPFLLLDVAGEVLSIRTTSRSKRRPKSTWA